jgi:hypothetical protein
MLLDLYRRTNRVEATTEFQRISSLFGSIGCLVKIENQKRYISLNRLPTKQTTMNLFGFCLPNLSWIILEIDSSWKIKDSRRFV